MGQKYFENLYKCIVTIKYIVSCATKIRRICLNFNKLWGMRWKSMGLFCDSSTINYFSACTYIDRTPRREFKWNSGIENSCDSTTLCERTIRFCMQNLWDIILSSRIYISFAYKLRDNSFIPHGISILYIHGKVDLKCIWKKHFNQRSLICTALHRRFVRYANKLSK